MTQTTLHFLGDWPWWAGFGLALSAGAAVWFLYQRDLRGVSKWARACLPALRALAIAMIVLMLSGPVLHHRQVVGQLSRLLVFVDGSQSMSLSDASMEPGRKILILQRLGLMSQQGVKMDLPQAAEVLSEARAIAERMSTKENLSSSEWETALHEFSRLIISARDLAKRAAFPENRIERMNDELMKPANQLAQRKMQQLGDRQKAAADLEKLAAALTRWEGEFSSAFEKVIGKMMSDAEFKAALQKFDNLPRWKRVQSLLLDGDEALLPNFAKNYETQLFFLDGTEAKKIWEPASANSALPENLPIPSSPLTNLSSGLKNRGGTATQGQREAIVLFTDGQHNQGDAPEEIARVFGSRQIPVFAVGLGSTVRPPDLAIVRIDGPDSVFRQDRVHGEITLKDDMPAGQPFTIWIKDGERVLWEQKLITENKQVRKVPFEFPIQDVVDAKLKESQNNDVELASLPLEWQVSISKLENDSEPSNNEAALRVRALTQKRKLLIVDGRPRWETRYLRNMFERDEQWDVNAVIAGTNAREPGLLRGDKKEQFPNETALQTYDLIVFGDLAKSLFKAEELKALQNFVSGRGGAIIFMDGPREHLKEYAGTALEPLFPVEWKTPAPPSAVEKLTLTGAGTLLPAFTLAEDQSLNGSLWEKLPVPHRIAGATPLPGAETMVEASIDGKRAPAVVYRAYGAGKVLYHAFDDSWRWRYEVADLHHVRYWHQVANWLAEPPFAVRDKRISLDAGPITDNPGDSANIRVRLQNEKGEPITSGTVDAVLYCDGKKAATIRLTPGEGSSGLFQGKTAPLEAGRYEVSVQSDLLPDHESHARAAFKVEAKQTGERTILNVNEELLREMAALSGGQYLREEHSSQLNALLAPIRQGKVTETDTVLSQSYWWFVPIMLLFTIEWILRKRSGLL